MSHTLRAALTDALEATYASKLTRDPAEQVRQLAAHFGNRRAAADALGFRRSTLDHWARGRTPAKAQLTKLRSAYTRTMRRPMIREAIAVRGLPREVWITAVVVAYPAHTGGAKYINQKIDGPGGERGWRTFRAGGAGRGRGLATHAMSEMVREWLARRDPTFPLLAEIEACYGAPFDFEGRNISVTIIT